MSDVYSALFLFSAISAASVLLGLLFYILIAVAAWRIMVKAGEPGWKGIIPVYNIYSLYKISWKTNMFLVLELLSSIIQSASDGFLLSFVGWICSVAGLVIGIMGLHKVSKAFGHGAGFTLGLIFLNPIFLLILGFGSSQYLGNLSWPNQARF